MKTSSTVVDLSPLASDLKELELNSGTKAKHCEKCCQSKPLTEFYKNGQDKSCKDCRRSARNQRYEKTKSESQVAAETKSSAGDVVSPEERKAKTTKRHSLLSPEDIHQIAEVLLILEGWQAQSDAQRELSNSKSIPKTDEQS